MAGVYDAQIGPLTPGQFGYMPINSAGVATGPATLALPALGVKVAIVQAALNNISSDALVSATGAPLHAGLLPVPEQRYNPTGL